jgi:hypothetical protein
MLVNERPLSRLRGQKTFMRIFPSLDRGRERLSPSPPSEPCVRFSRTRLSSRWFPHQDRLANVWASLMVKSPISAKKAFIASSNAVASAAHMPSFHTEASTHVHFPARVSASCLALAGTADASLWLCLSVKLTHPPSCLPSLGAALLSALLAASHRCGTMKALTPAPLTYGPGLPAYFATPSCRSISNHVGCLVIAYRHASVTSAFRASPLGVAGSPQLPAESSSFAYGPTVRLQLLSTPPRGRRSYLQLRSLWLPPTRTFTVLMWRPHGRTTPDPFDVSGSW